ncbi:hypothetical protein L218DRAFT_925491 [Marasmius fiardii PR-910]|nr:hypothetical protein L218DRAFT_925491 [Marasmius fiardii PR-910]
MTTPSDPLLSPALTTASACSFDLVSSTSRSRSSTISVLVSQDDSEEEIVWTVARRRSPSGRFDSSGTEEESEDDFVLLSRRPAFGAQPSTPPANTPNHNSGLPIADFARLSLNNSHASPASEIPCNDAIPKSSTQVRPYWKRGKQRAKKVPVLAGFGERPIVDDASSEIATEGGIEDGAFDAKAQQSAYKEAVQFVTMFLTNPGEHNTNSGRLTLLQSIVIELGLSTATPSSVTSAKALLKSQAFVNVRDYLAVREQGLEAIQRVMHPSRSALARSIKKSKKRVSIQWIKDRGLDVFLIPCYYHKH